MAINLLDLLSKALPPSIAQSLSKIFGEQEAIVQNGNKLILPALLGGLASKASTPSGASSVFAALTSPQVDSKLPENLGTLLNSGQASSLTHQGGSFLSDLFGSERALAVGPALAGVSKLKTGSATGMAALAAGVVFGALKKLIGDQNLNAAQTAELLTGQKSYLLNRLEPALTGALGLGSPASLLTKLSPAAAAVERTAVEGGAVAAAGLSRWVPWLIGLLLLLFALWYFFGRSPQAPAAAPEVPVTAAVPAMVDLKTPVRVNFGTGKADLGPDANAIVKSVAALMDKDKSIKVDLTGYTDKTGDSAANQELAKNRALAVQSALIAMGVSADRVDTKPPIFVEIGANGGDAEARRVEITAR